MRVGRSTILKTLHICRCTVESCRWRLLHASHFLGFICWTLSQYWCFAMQLSSFLLVDESCGDILYENGSWIGFFLCCTDCGQSSVTEPVCFKACTQRTWSNYKFWCEQSTSPRWADHFSADWNAMIAGAIITNPGWRVLMYSGQIQILWTSSLSWFFRRGWVVAAVCWNCSKAYFSGRRTGLPSINWFYRSYQSRLSLLCHQETTSLSLTFVFSIYHQGP